MLLGQLLHKTQRIGGALFRLWHVDAAGHAVQ
jgi:hypothetical protein